MACMRARTGAEHLVRVHGSSVQSDEPRDACGHHSHTAVFHMWPACCPPLVTWPRSRRTAPAAGSPAAVRRPPHLAAIAVAVVTPAGGTRTPSATARWARWCWCSSGQASCRRAAPRRRPSRRGKRGCRAPPQRPSPSPGIPRQRGVSHIQHITNKNIGTHRRLAAQRRCVV